MNCARRTCVYAIIIGFTMCAQGFAAYSKEGANAKPSATDNMAAAPAASVDKFQWQEHNKLSWEDFRGAVRAATDASAAATHCGIGFKTVNSAVNGKPEVIVYNNFYTNQSWVRNDARIPSILEHEQGHFDLCEIYTRKLRERMSHFNFNVPDVKEALMNIYAEITSQYESRQQQYEEQTAHGTITAQQRRWRQIMTAELTQPLASL